MAHYHSRPEDQANAVVGILFRKLGNALFWLAIIWLAARLVFNMGVDEGKRRCAAGDCTLSAPELSIKQI